jgi:putative DNA primase/helicase
MTQNAPSMLDAALAHARRGWPVFPLYEPVWAEPGGPVACSCGDPECRNIGKHPRIGGGFTNATTDEAQIREWWAKWPNANIGVPTGEVSGTVVIDEDPRHGGDHTLSELEAKHGRLPETVMQLTGGGGRHHCFAHPGGYIKSRNGVLPGIDIKADRGYIVVEPSLHESGNRYVFELSSLPGEVELAEMPVWVLDLVTEPKQPKSGTRPVPTGDVVTVAMDERERRCRSYLAKCPDAISKQDGHGKTLRAACECFRFGLDEAAAWGVMHWFNDAKTGGEPWTEKELEHKIDDARTKVMADGEVGVRLRSGTGAPLRSELEYQAGLLTDVGNAARLLLKRGDDLRYSANLGVWLIWDGKRWKPDDRKRIVTLCKETALSILDEAKRADDDRRDALMKWARDSQKKDRITAMAALAEPEVAVGPDDLDADPWLFNCKNGTIDLRTGELRPHTREDLITKMAPVEYDPDAGCPRFMRFLDEIFDEDLGLVGFVQRWLGYCLTGDITEQILPIFWGEGGNGKSVLIDTTVLLMGDYAGVAPPDLLVVRKHQEHPTELADLMGKRLVVASESERGAELRLQLVKRLTGDATIKGRFMRQDYFEFPRTHKLILVTNNRPEVKEDTEAAWRRLRLVAFTVVIPPEKRDKQLMKKLKAEWPGILAWMVRGCLDWQRDGLGEPEKVMLATAEYRGVSNSVKAFLDDRCTRGEGLYVPAKDLLVAYAEWCARARLVPLKGKEWGAALKSLGCQPKRLFGDRHWLGIELSDPSDDGSDGFDTHSRLAPLGTKVAVHTAGSVKSDQCVIDPPSQPQNGSSGRASP